MSLANKLTQERRSRLAAERMLELKQAELFAANRKLGSHAQQLSEEIVETRAQVETIRGENQRVKSDLTVANQKIAIAERRLWHSIETINDGFAFFNADHEMIMANRAYLAIFDGLEVVCPGVNYVTILQVLTDEGIVNIGDMAPADWRQMMLNRFQLANPEPTVIQLWNEQHIKLIDQRGPEGDIVSLALNITATVIYERQLEEARAIAETANRAKSAFLANMSHEIRTPMNGVIGMADLLQDGTLNEEQELYVQTIKNSGEALLVIINDVLDYSKIEARKLELHPAPFDLERAILEVLMLLQSNAQDKGVPILLDYDLFLPTEMIGDAGRIRQVLTNLIGNAIKFTSEGHVLVRVTGVADETHQSLNLHVSIEDTGIGIPEDMVGHIFGEFNQVQSEKNRQFEGTGLGLAITKRLVEMMQGDIWVTSEEGVGSCFGFQLRLDLNDTAKPPTWRPPKGLSHVLIIDRPGTNRNITERQLSRLGMRVTCADTVSTATAACDDTVDLITANEDSRAAASDMIAQTGREIPLILLCANQTKAAAKHPDGIAGAMQNPPGRDELFTTLGGLTFAPPPEPLPVAVPQEPETAQKARKMRILAAEDNKTNQLVFRKMMKKLNIDLTFANNGEEAVELFQKIQPDLIFMDISMPKMDGREATCAIRALEKGNGHTPIVALTAHAMEGDDAEILAAGLDHYLTKPLRKALIVEQIKNAHAPSMLPLSAPQEDG